jgi:hypothetical protein
VGSVTAWRRLPLLAIGGVTLAAGLLAGESRLGWDGPAGGLIDLRGPLMVSAFFGSVIGLERAVALGHRWGYAAPLATGLGGLALIGGWLAAGSLLLGLGSLIFAGMAWLVVKRQPALFTVVLACGAVCWVIGNAVWAGGAPVFDSVAWWICFLVLTVVGDLGQWPELRLWGGLLNGLVLCGWLAFTLAVAVVATRRRARAAGPILRQAS